MPNQTKIKFNQIDSTDLATKQDTLVSGTNIKTINNQSILGSGNIEIQGGSSTQQLADGTDLDTIKTEGNYAIKNATSTLGLPTLSNVSSSGISARYYILTVKKYNITNIGDVYRQTIIVSPLQGGPGAGIVANEADIFTRCLLEDQSYTYKNQNWIKIDGNFEVVSVINHSPGSPFKFGPLIAGYVYICNSLNSLDSLTLENIENTGGEIRVVFKAGENFVLNQTQLTWLNCTTPTFTNGTTYILTIKNLYATLDNIGENEYLTNKLATKQDILVSGTNIKTINNESLLGSGNINIQGQSSLTQTDYYNRVVLEEKQGIEGDIGIDQNIYLSQITEDRWMDDYTYDGTDWKNYDGEVVDLENLGITIEGTYSSGATFSVYSECLTDKNNFNFTSTINPISIFLNGILLIKGRDYRINDHTIEFINYTLKSTDSISFIA